MAISKKPPVPPSKPKKPEKPESAPDVLELSADDISEDKPSTLMGVPMLPQIDVPAPEAKPKEKPAEPVKAAAPVKAAEPVRTPAPAKAAEPVKAAEPEKPAEPALKTLIGVPALEPEAKKSETKSEPPPKTKSEAPPKTKSEPPPKKREVTASDPPPAPLAIQRSRLPEPLRAIIEGPRPRLIAFASATGLVLLIFIGVIIRAISSSSSSETTTTSASASATQSAAPVDSSALLASATASASATPPPPKPISCSVSGEAHVVSPRAVVASGIEIVAVDSLVALGFAKTATAAMTIELDPTTMSATGAHSSDARDTIKRVTPMASGKMAIDIDSRGDAIRGRRLVGEYDVGAKSGELVWAPHGTSKTKALWKLGGDAPVEATRGAASDGSIAIAYRYDGAIWVGLAKGAELTPAGPVHVAGLGPQIGSPAIAMAGGKVIVAWADRADKSAPWGLRWFVWTEGTDPVAQSFAVPTGGLGENVMSPNLTALADGSFLLVWTEGPMGGQQVRAHVLANDGTPRGNTIEVSGAGVHAGQGCAAVLPDGRGVIAFLSAAAPAFEVRATGIRCAPGP